MKALSYMNKSEQLLIDGLNALSGPPLPYELFGAIARLVVSPAIEAVFLRPGAEGLEVLLTKRPEDDIYWPGMWHVPGTVLRPTDEPGSYNSAFARVCTGELGLYTWGKPVFVSSWFWQTARGAALSLVHLFDASLIQNFPEGEFFSVSKLPVPMVAEMDVIIALAVKHYSESMLHTEQNHKEVGWAQ